MTGVIEIPSGKVSTCRSNLLRIFDPCNEFPVRLRREFESKPLNFLVDWRSKSPNGASNGRPQPVLRTLAADNRFTSDPSIPRQRHPRTRSISGWGSDRAHRLAEIQHRAGLRIEHRPFRQAGAVWVAGGGEIHPIVGQGAGKVAILLGPRPFMRNEIAEHVSELSSTTGAEVLAEIFDIVFFRGAGGVRWK